MRHPFQVAKEIADLIKNDPVAARQVKDYMSKDELLNALELYPTDEELLDRLESRLLGMPAAKRVKLMEKLQKEMDS